MSVFTRDWLERVGWTVAEAALAVVAVEVAELEGVYVPVIAAGLAALKGLVARQMGDPDSAATLPAE